MMRSMFSGVSGLRIHQTKMDVIANNISNVNTVGYKSSRVTFNEVFSQAISGASAPNPALNRGGTNPRQIGLGATLSSIDKLMTNGAAQRTDNPLDLMIQGDGFFIVGDGSGVYFTRDGSFAEDKDGNFSLNGLKLMGWDAVKSAADKDYVIEKIAAKPIMITGTKQEMGAVPTTQIDFNGNFNPNTDPVIQRTISFYDTVGNKYLMDVTLTYNPASSTLTDSAWTVSFPTAATDNKTYIYSNGDRAKPIEVAAVPDFPITFNTSGQIASVNGAAAPVPMITAVTITPAGLLDPPAVLGDGTGHIDLDFTNANQFVNETTNLIALNRDGNAPGHLGGLSVGMDGKITGRYSNGETRLLAQIPLAKFQNPAGLIKMGGNLFSLTPNSGDFDGIGLEGEIMGGVLEMSNVDLSQEFTEMITTQRGFQANSRVISTSDEMLQELVNLKR